MQRIDLAGTRLWGNYGIQVFEPWDTRGYAYGSLSEHHALTTSDGAGGAFLGFNFYLDSDHTRNMEAIRIDGSGQRTKGTQTSEGTICGLNHASQYTHTPGDVSAIPSGDGGAIYAWQTNYYNGANSSSHIYAQKVNADCAVVWPLHESYGVPVCTAEGGQGKIRDASPDGLDLTTDGSGGAIITWIDRRPDDQFRFDKVFAQRINNLGNAVWTPNGIVVAKLPYIYSWEPRVVSDNAGGAIVSFLDQPGLRTQRLNASGSQIWAEDKALDKHGTGDFVRYRYHDTVLHENGNVVAVWQDYRNTGNEVQTFTNIDVYTQFISRDASLVPTYTLTISTSGAGKTNPEIGSYLYPAGTLLFITATPLRGYKFASWTGDAVDNSMAAQTTVFIDANKTVTANFIMAPMMTPIPGVSGPGLWVMAGLLVSAAFWVLRRMRKEAKKSP